jgi:hypothetical protein
MLQVFGKRGQVSRVLIGNKIEVGPGGCKASNVKKCSQACRSSHKHTCRIRLLRILLDLGSMDRVTSSSTFGLEKE